MSMKQTDSLTRKGFTNNYLMTQKKIKQKKFNNAIKKLKSEKLLDEKIATKMKVQEAKTPVLYAFKNTQTRKCRKISETFC